MKFNINKSQLILESSASVKPQESTVGQKVAVGGLGTIGVIKAAPILAKLGAVAKLAKVGTSGGAIGLRGENWKDSAINSAVASGLGTAAVNGVGMVLGSGVPLGAIGIASGMAAAKGGALGAVVGNGRDTLAKSTLLPAAIVAGSAPLTNAAMDAAGYNDIEADPVMGAVLSAGAGGIGWALRNRGNKKKLYI